MKSLLLVVLSAFATVGSLADFVDAKLAQQ